MSSDKTVSSRVWLCVHCPSLHLLPLLQKFASPVWHCSQSHLLARSRALSLARLLVYRLTLVTRCAEEEKGETPRREGKTRICHTRRTRDLAVHTHTYIHYILAGTGGKETFCKSEFPVPVRVDVSVSSAWVCGRLSLSFSVASSGACCGCCAF